MGIGLILGSLLLLFHFSSVPNERPNGFIRNWKPEALVLQEQISISAPLKSICGTTQNSVYFNVPNPSKVLSVDINLKKLDTIGFGLPLPEHDIGVNSTIVDSPYVWFFAQNIPALYRGQLKFHNLEYFPLPLVYTRAVKIKQDKIVLRSLDTALTKQVFQKISLNNSSVLSQVDLILDQKNGGFDRDGWLKFDEISGRIYYLEFYRNLFYCLDTSLNLIYMAKTIDTISNQEITIQKVNIDGDERIMPTSPRIHINKECFIGNGMLWVLSGLKAENQSYKNFRENVPVDLYALKDGKYLGSINIPRIGVVRPKSFAVVQNILVALYEKDIRTYRIKI